VPPATVSQPTVVAANAPVVSPAALVKSITRAVPIAKTTPVSATLTQKKATLSLAISPWGEVFIDGKSKGVSPPLNSLQLEAGRHTVEIRNNAFASYRDTVNVKPGQSLKIKHKFR